jgi:hypothetical protein
MPILLVFMQCLTSELSIYFHHVKLTLIIIFVFIINKHMGGQKIIILKFMAGCLTQIFITNIYKTRNIAYSLV